MSELHPKSLSRRAVLGAAAAAPLLFVANQARAADDGLPSWNDGATKSAILKFIADVTTEGPNFVAEPERIAVFDNDGTLWAEQPMYVQMFFVIDRVKALAPNHPEWANTEPFKSVLAGDLKGVLASGEKGLLDLVGATHAGMTEEEFEKIVKDWIATAKHPKTGKLFTDMTYKPMKELLALLRTKGFKTFIVSGGGVEFMRPWTEAAYGIPPEQVVGSSIKLSYEIKDGKPVIMRLPQLDFYDDKEAKPLGIQKHIGRRPIAAFGNSDGDFQMLEWTTSAPGQRFGAFVHHDDAEREWAYDRNSRIGTLKRGLDEAAKRGWTLISMKDDWATIF